MARRSIHLLAVVAVMAVSVLFAGCSGASSSLTTSNAWARPGSSGGDTAAYLTIANAGTSPDTLVSASSPAAGTVELHESATDATGMTGMHPIDGIEIPAGGSVTLEPGAKHLMVMGLATDLTSGGTLDLDLVFKNAGTVKVKAEVKQP